MTDVERFKNLLRSTSRHGVENVITNLEELGFFNAPASTSFHLNTPGGLLTHSMNVFDEAVAIATKQIELCPAIEDTLPKESLIIASLLHDVCKAEIYKDVAKWKKDSNGHWESIPGYEVDYSDLPIGHGEKSVIRLLQWGLELTDAEMLAIRWHMGAWELAMQSPEAKTNMNVAKAKCPLIAVICAADSLAAAILERQ